MTRAQDLNEYTRHIYEAQLDISSRDSAASQLPSTRNKPLTPTVLAALHECEVRFVLLRSGIRGKDTPEKKLGRMAHKIREMQLKSRLHLRGE